MPAVYSATGSIGAGGVWGVIVTLGGVDSTARIVGDITIEGEEGSARIADLVYQSQPGDVFEVADWTGLAVTVDIADMATGSASNIRRLFTGVVDTPALDLVQRTISLSCTDGLQTTIEAMTVAAIDAAIPSGYASPVIFDPAARGWSRAQDRLSTVAASLEMTPAGVLRLTNWAPKATADLVFTEDHVLDESVGVELASRSSLINRVDIDFGYRFPRVKAEGHPVSFSYVNETNFATYVAANNWFLQRAAVESAIESAGGTIETISYTPLPNAPIGSWVPGPYDSELCMGFEAMVSFDYGQTIDEEHTIIVNTPESIAVAGTLSDRLSGALEGQYPPMIAVETAALLWKNDISGVPPQDTATPVAGFTTSANVTLTADTNRTAANAAMQSLIAVAKVKIHAAHRLNTVSAAIPLNPDADVDKTIEIDVPSVHARGKCRAITHRLSPEAGTATTELQIAICAIAGTGIVHDDTANTAPAASTPATTPIITTPTVVFNGGAAQDHTITITFPAVEDEERDRAVVPLTATYHAAITEDLFEITL